MGQMTNMEKCGITMALKKGFGGTRALAHL